MEIILCLQGTADFLTRATTVLAIAFCTSILLAMIAGYGKTNSIIDEVSQDITEDNKNKDTKPAVPTD